MVVAQDYDILFMDVQMPEMDGFAATREIRKLAKAGIDRLPILAMTAHALTGDREKSLAVGMNDHVAKPIDMKKLYAALRRWLSPEKFAEVACDVPDSVSDQGRLFTPPAPALDMEEGINRLGGNRELYMRLLRDFIAGYGETPEQLMQELRAERREEAVHRVHAIRGIVASLGGKALATAAAEMETALQQSEQGVSFALGEPLRVFIDRHEALIMAIGAILARQPAVLPVRREGPPGDLVELRDLLKRLKEFLGRKEPLPCKEIMVTLLQKRWSESYEETLAELNRLVQRYRLTEAIGFLDKEFKDIEGKMGEKNDE